MEEAPPVVVGGGDVGGVGGDGVVRGGLGAHGGCEAAAEGAGALHLHALCQRHLVLEGLLVVGASAARPSAAAGAPRGGRGRAAAAGGVRGDLLGGCRGKAEEVRPRVRGSRACARRGAAPSGVHRQGTRGRTRCRGVQRPLGEGAHRPGVVVVGRRESCLAAVQPGQAGAVEQVGAAHLAPCQASVSLAVGDPGPGMGRVGVVRVALGVQVVEEDVHFIRR